MIKSNCCEQIFHHLKKNERTPRKGKKDTNLSLKPRFKTRPLQVSFLEMSSVKLLPWWDIILLGHHLRPLWKFNGFLFVYLHERAFVVLNHFKPTSLLLNLKQSSISSAESSSVTSPSSNSSSKIFGNFLALKRKRIDFYSYCVT